MIEFMLHFLWGFLLIALPWVVFRRPEIPFWGLPLAGIVAATLVLPRELVDQWPVERWLDTATDLLGFFGGGTGAGMLGVFCHAD